MVLGFVGDKHELLRRKSPVHTPRLNVVSVIFHQEGISRSVDLEVSGLNAQDACREKETRQHDPGMRDNEFEKGASKFLSNRNRHPVELPVDKGFGRKYTGRRSSFEA